MNTQLPETYLGYDTKELLELWEAIPGGGLRDVDVPSDKLRAMRLFLLEYKINPVQHISPLSLNKE